MQHNDLLQNRPRDKERGIRKGCLENFNDFVSRWESIDELSASAHIALGTSLPLKENEKLLRQTLPMWPVGFTG